VKQNDDTDQEIGNDESEDLGESTLMFDIEQDDLDTQQKVVLQTKACQNNSLYWKSAQPRARVRPMAERPMLPCHSVYRETARVERTISLLDFLTAPATISNRL